MSALSRYLAAIAHLGPRQAALNLLHRGRLRLRSYARYTQGGCGVAWRGRSRAALLAHSGGTRLSGGRLAAAGESHPVGDPPDWEASGPLLWIYNLHYFGWLDALAPAEQRRVVLDWIERYTASRSRPGWWPYPLSLRLRHWVRASLEGGSLAEARDRVLPSIEAQGECLADTVEHHLRGNHLLENAITLKLLAAVLQGPGPARWGRLAERVLERELPEQFLLDGGHVERSPMYHALLVHGLLDLVNVLPEDDEARVRLVERMPGLLQFLAAMRHPDGEIALFNDAAFGIAPEPAALFEYAARLGFAAPESAGGSFPVTGYHVFRKGGDALFVDAGPIGPDYVPTHAHGDIFSFELSLDGHRIVVDGGTSTYVAGAERAWARSTRAHNTVEVAGADQCEFFGAFRVGRRGRPRDVTARVSEAGLELSGWHDGYRRLRGRPVHTRMLAYRDPGALAVWDVVESNRPQPVTSRVRFAPGARVELAGASVARVEHSGVTLLLRAFGGALALEAGHYAPRFGERVACPVVALHAHSGAAFGYLLARRSLEGFIDARGAEVAGHPLPRPHLSRPGPRG